MPTITNRIGLKKPLGNETVSRESYNENLDILDNKFGTLNGVGEVKEKVNKSDFDTLKKTNESQMADNVTKTKNAQTTADSAKKRADEAFQSGVDVKRKTVTAINAKKGNVTVNDSWDKIIQEIPVIAGDYKTGDIVELNKVQRIYQGIWSLNYYKETDSKLNCAYYNIDSYENVYYIDRFYAPNKIYKRNKNGSLVFQKSFGASGSNLLNELKLYKDKLYVSLLCVNKMLILDTNGNEIASSIYSGKFYFYIDNDFIYVLTINSTTITVTKRDMNGTILLSFDVSIVEIMGGTDRLINLCVMNGNIFFILSTPSGNKTLIKINMTSKSIQLNKFIFNSAQFVVAYDIKNKYIYAIKNSTTLIRLDENGSEVNTYTLTRGIDGIIGFANECLFYTETYATYNVVLCYNIKTTGVTESIGQVKLMDRAYSCEAVSSEIIYFFTETSFERTEIYLYDGYEILG